MRSATTVSIWQQLSARSYHASKVYPTGPLINRIRNNIQCGQPIHETRPHLLNPGELTPGIPASEYYQRRIDLSRRLIDINSNNKNKSILAILIGNQLKYASGPVFYPFQQNNNFFYLSGFNEPDAMMMLEITTTNDSTTSNIEPIFHLVVPGKNSFMEQWQGFRTGTDGAVNIFNADNAIDNESNDLFLLLQNLIKRNDIIYIDQFYSSSSSNNSIKNNPFFSKLIDNAIEKVSFGYHEKQFIINDLNNILAQQRLVKSDNEINVLKKICNLSAISYNDAFKLSNNNFFKNEKLLHSFLEFKFIQNGADKSAYVPVVASGSNALCIHYTSNNDLIYNDELVLVDAAGNYGGYCADISRTWPANPLLNNTSKFSDPQREIYQAVLNTQKRCIELCTESNQISINDIHEKSLEFMFEELKNTSLNISNKSQVSELYPHYIGHNLGLDLHDVPETSRLNHLKKNQVITIEPGIYIPDSPNYQEHFRNIGVRIEDDILVGNNSPHNLTEAAAKEINDIESLMNM